MHACCNIVAKAAAWQQRLRSCTAACTLQKGILSVLWAEVSRCCERQRSCEESKLSRVCALPKQQAIQAGGLANALPNLAQPSTVFAPVNSAFYHVLTGTSEPDLSPHVWYRFLGLKRGGALMQGLLHPCADFGLDQLAKAGSKLQSVLLYHVLPNGAFTPAQLAAARSDNTLLGSNLTASYPLSFSTNATNGVRFWQCLSALLLHAGGMQACWYCTMCRA